MIVLIIGLPNAGKTTYSERFENVLHLDDFPPSKFLNCNEAVRKAVDDVVVEGIYNLRCRRERLLEAYQGNGRKVCIWIDTPADVCVGRENRGRHEQVVRAHLFQPPTYDEGWDEIIRITAEETSAF